MKLFQKSISCHEARRETWTINFYSQQQRCINEDVGEEQEVEEEEGRRSWR